MMMHCVRALGVFLLLSAGVCDAGIYRYQDASGQWVFSDRPPDAAAEPVEAAPVNRFESPPAAAPTPRLERPAPAQPPYAALQVVGPQDDETIHDNAGRVTVRLASEPALQADHRYVVLLDGATAASADARGIATLDNVDRGTHRLAAQIRDAQDRVLIQSAERAIHVKRLSLAQRKRVRPCTLEDYGVRLECPLHEKPKPRRDIPFVPFL